MTRRRSAGQKGRGSRVSSGDLSEVILRKVLEHAPVGVALFDLTRRPVLVNQVLCDMLSYTADALVRMRFTEFTRPEDVQAEWALFRELLQGRRSSYTLRKRYIRKDGQVVTALLSVSLVRGARGVPRSSSG